MVAFCAIYFGYNYVLSWFVLRLLEVFIPDIRRAVPIALQLGFWLTPIVYTPDILPDWAQPFLVFNPLAHALGAVQAIVVFNRNPDLESVFLLIILAFKPKFALCFWVLDFVRLCEMPYKAKK